MQKSIKYSMQTVKAAAYLQIEIARIQPLHIVRETSVLEIWEEVHVGAVDYSLVEFVLNLKNYYISYVYSSSQLLQVI